MPKLNSYQELIADWERLLAAIEETPYEIPGIDEFRAALEQAVERARALKTRQAVRSAASRQATRQLQESVAQGREAAFSARSYLKGRLGPRNEDLSRFGVKPSRKRGPRRQIVLRG